MYVAPRTMSTQHPDNARIPYFASGNVLSGDDEILEAYLLFSQFGCQEQLWDFEGKKAVPWVVSELLSKDQEFFENKRLGKEIFLTFRIPNPEVEKVEAKLVPEILASIPRCYDTTNAVYQTDFPPVFEIVLPMTTSSHQLNRVYHYYNDFVVGNSELPMYRGDNFTVSQWLGDFNPERINIIPLFEDRDSMLNAADITAEYLEDKSVEYQRVFLARSDPALNYGSLSAVLMVYIALQRLDKLEKKRRIPIYPILGIGSAPFRGNFKPTNIEAILNQYRSCQTYTIQSAFKYDWAFDMVARAINEINSTSRGDPVEIDEGKSISLIEKSILAYQEQIPEISSLVTRLASFLPQRRRRKLHAGLFEYSRTSGEIQLPRAIPFCASLYSIGLPPELLGLHILDKDDIKAVKEVYPSPMFEEDLRDALAFYNPRVLSLLSMEMREKIEKALKIIGFETDEAHLEITSQIISCLENNDVSRLPELIIAASNARRFLG